MKFALHSVKPSLFTLDSGCIVVSVRLARSLEEMSVPQEGPRLTKLLEESHRRAGREGDFLFMVSLVVMTLVSYIVACFSFGAGCRSCRLVSSTPGERLPLLFGKRTE